MIISDCPVSSFFLNTSRLPDNEENEVTIHIIRYMEEQLQPWQYNKGIQVAKTPFSYHP